MNIYKFNKYYKNIYTYNKKVSLLINIKVRNLSHIVMLSDSQILVALLFSLVSAVLAIRLGIALYK